MDIIVFLGYLLLFSILVFRTPFYRRNGLSPGWVLGLYLVKVGVGALYGWWFAHQPGYETKVDTWRYFFASIEEKEWLLNDPAGFWTDLVTPRYPKDTGILGVQNSLLNDLKEVLIIKLAAVMNVVSGSRYYVNLIFYNYLVLFGQVGLGIIWANQLRLRKPMWMVTGLILWPSILFWSSGFHRDGLMLHCLGWSVWLCYEMAIIKRRTWTRLVLLVLHTGLLFLLRNYLALAMVVAVAMAALVFYRPQMAKWLIPTLVISGMLVLVLISKLNPALSLPSLLAGRQAEFLNLEGGSQVAPLPLDEGWGGLWRSLPEAANRVFASPLPASGLKAVEWPAALENMAWLVSILPAIWFQRTRPVAETANGWWVLILFIVLPVAFLTGLTIPFIGAIARYKIILWPLMAPLVLHWWGGLFQKLVIKWNARA